VAFQGERGANSEDAIVGRFGTTPVLPCRTFAAVFAAVEDGTARAGLVPIENSLAGSITDTYDLLRASPLIIAGEVLHPVVHCLVALPGQTLDQITEVLSHPQALAQCDVFLKEHGLEPVAANDTAGSARLVRDRGMRGTAAISSRRAAALYGLEVLAESVQTSRDNVTRFYVIAHEPAPKGRHNKTAIVFTTPNRPAALFWCLGALACRSINLTKLESRPGRERPFEYVFHAEFDGHTSDEDVVMALKDLSAKATGLKVLGSFPKAD
jgi:prephenate dehydratase/chorismate mutase/prephenate dehydratase